MKPKLTKAQLAKAKRAVVADLQLTLKAGVIGDSQRWFLPAHPEHRECVRLLKVALKAVRGA